jgi:hypothetical protein
LAQAKKAVAGGENPNGWTLFLNFRYPLTERSPAPSAFHFAGQKRDASLCFYW